jgi:predicted  nucleic acid-binding Zn-ribbon protein
MQKLLLLSAAVAARGDETNPLAKVIELMDDCTAKVKADAEASEKAFKEYYEWCDDAAKNAGFAIKTAKAKKEKLEASIEKGASEIEVSTSKVEDLAEAVSAAEKELEGATKVREEEAADFAKAEAELVDGVDTLDRAIGILEREMAKNPAAFAQIDTSNMNKMISALGTVIEAAAFTAQDKAKLTALVQSSSDDDDSEEGAPAPDSYKSKSGGIVDVLNDMKEKAEGELSDLRKVEGNAKQNFMMLKQSLEGQIEADTKEMDDQKSAKAAAEEQKATDEADLTVTDKDLTESTASLGKTTSSCLTAAADHESNVAAREEEIGVIAEAKKILQETTGAAASFLQTSMVTRMDLKRGEITSLVKGLAKSHHSAALAQLASRIGVVMEYGGAASDVFAKVKGLITDMIAKLEKEAEEDAAEKAYCDEEMGKTQAKKEELDDEIAKLSTKMDQQSSASTRLKDEVKEAQEELAALAKEQAEMDGIRSEQRADYSVASKDLKLGLGGIQKALEKLREYYGGAALLQSSDMAFMQQPAAPQKAEKQSGAGQSIIGILEVCESDFSKGLAKEEQEESDAQGEYDTTTQENKITKTTREQDVKFKTQEFKALDAEITELTGDRETSQTELDAVMEYYGKIKDRCVAKPETYEERTARRNAEIEGLKQALSILENETAFVQRKHRSFRGHKLQ